MSHFDGDLFNIVLKVADIIALLCLALSLLAVNFEDRWWPLQTIWISDEAPQGASSEIQIVWHSDYISAKEKGRNNDFFENFGKETNIWKNYPACKDLSRTLL